MRTTSSVESLNAQLNRSFPKRGNIFQFINCLKIFEFGKAEAMRHLVSWQPNNQLQRKRKADREREQSIRKHTAALHAKEIDLEEFIDAVANDEALAKGIYCIDSCLSPN